MPTVREGLNTLATTMDVASAVVKKMSAEDEIV